MKEIIHEIVVSSFTQDQKETWRPYHASFRTNLTEWFSLRMKLKSYFQSIEEIIWMFDCIAICFPYFA